MSKYLHLSNDYNELQEKVLDALQKEIAMSKLESDHIQGNALKVNVFDYSELVMIDGRLIFLDSHGYHYSLFSEATIEDLIDILNNIK